MATVADAVRELREALGDSQQAFATRMGLSIRAVANYEKDRVPIGPILMAMYHQAEKIDEKLGKKFWHAINSKFGFTEEAARRIHDVDITVGAAALRFEQFLRTLNKSHFTKEQKEFIEKTRSTLSNAKKDLESLDPFWLDELEKEQHK